MTSPALDGHATALLLVCLKPCIEANSNIESFSENVRDLVDCLIKYSTHLKLQLQKQIDQQSSSTPSGTVAEDVSVQHCNAACEVKTCYLPLDKDVRKAGLLRPVLFSKALHLKQPFANAMQRLRFIENMHLLMLTLSITLQVVLIVRFYLRTS